MFYLFISFILLIFPILEFFNLNNISRKIFVGCAAIILCLVAGLRYETGGDWDIYLDIFKNIQISPISLGNSDIEIGYLFLNLVVKLIGGNLQFVFFIISFINTIILLKCLDIYIPQRKLLGILIYYLVFYFSLEMIYTRQSISLLLCVYAFQYIKERNLIKYILIIGLAFLFHRMSLLMFPLYFIINCRFSILSILLLVIVGMLLMGLRIQWMIPLYLKCSQALGDVFYNKALYYVSTSEFTVERSVSIGYILNVFLLFIFIWKRKLIRKNVYGELFFNLYIGSLIIYFYLYELIEVSMRLRFYFFISIVFLFPMIIQETKTKIDRYIITLFIFVYSLIFNRHILFEYPLGAAYNPYQNYLLYKFSGKKSTGKERLKQSISITKQNRQELKEKNEKSIIYKSYK